MDNSFSTLINSAVSILVLLPNQPSFDTVAAGLSLYLSIRDKKSVDISCPSPMMVGFNRIIGIDKISYELGNKNLTIKFKGYDAANIEKVSYDIIQGEFNLTVVPKSGFASPQKEQMDLSFSGVSSDLVILVGGANDSDFPVLSSQELSSAKVAHVGNRQISSAREVLSFSSSGSSNSEVVASLIKVGSMEIDPDIATNLIMGIEDGTSNFATNEVTPETFETFAYLLRSGGLRQSKTKLSPSGFPPGAIPTQPFHKPIQKPVAVSPTAQMSPVINPDPILSQVETKEETVTENPPDDWLQPKVFKNSSNPPMGQSDSFSENKG